jgi:hypothetical protein
MTEEVKEKKKKELPISQVTACKSTQQMLRKAAEDGVETAFHRAADMKACPIGADSACCKHCSALAGFLPRIPMARWECVGQPSTPLLRGTLPGWWPVVRRRTRTMV